jgi:serine/threonine protein kinase
MASVYCCTDLQNGEKVAIKILHPGAVNDPEMLGRFQREHEIGVTLDHPGVIKVLNIGADRLQNYIVMEWVEGRSLRDILEDASRLSPQRCIRIAIGICDAVEYIHRHGVVHRDLKPENIMVGAGDRITLLDFGIASRAGARRLTFGKPSQLMGTPDYISPEQLKGKVADGRTDIYALGVILYEMLAGSVPFCGATPLAIMNERLRKTPALPPEVERNIAPELRAIIFRALERNPRKRYSSAAVLASDLTQVEESKSTGMISGTSRRSRRHQRLLFYTFLALIPCVVFLSLLFAARAG